MSVEGFQDIMMEDFTGPAFRQVFSLYFKELGIEVRDWDGLFREMNTDGRGNRAFLRMAGDQPVGFIQFCPMELASWFFTKRAGFVREFWVAPAYRGQGHGTALLGLAESWFQNQGFTGAILTTNTAPAFYTRRGYQPDPGFQAKNSDPVFIKRFF